MNDGVALLLERMKTNPDEFIDGGKWAHIMNKHEDFLDVEDRQALTNGLNKLMQQRFTEKVMEELVDPKGLRLKPMTLNPSNTTWNGASATVSSASFYPTTVIPPV
jgi:hypothetical protein